MMTTSRMTCLQPLEDTYIKVSPHEIKGGQGSLEILEPQLGSTDKAPQILKEVQNVFPQTGALALPLQSFC